MKKITVTEREAWLKVKKQFRDEEVTLGRGWSYNIHNDPKRLGFVLSRYKFAAKMTGEDKRILELGCSEGIGVPVLSEFCKSYLGIDSDAEAIDRGCKNWGNEKIKFISDDFLGKKYGSFDSIVSFDVIEHIERRKENKFLETVCQNLGENGICLIGTPNIISSRYASLASRRGHVNLFSSECLFKFLKIIFYNVFIFSMNDELVHTGFFPMAHYLIALGCYKRKASLK